MNSTGSIGCATHQSIWESDLGYSSFLVRKPDGGLAPLRLNCGAEGLENCFQFLRMIEGFFKMKLDQFRQILAGRGYCHLDLTACSLAKQPAIAVFAGGAFDSGEGRRTSKAAIDEGVFVPTLTTAIHERFSSCGDADCPEKLLSAIRYTFGGHLGKSITVKATR
jgi:hypothetical protein